MTGLERQRGALARPQLQRARVERQRAAVAALLQHLRCTGALQPWQVLPAERQALACVCYACSRPAETAHATSCSCSQFSRASWARRAGRAAGTGRGRVG